MLALPFPPRTRTAHGWRLAVILALAAISLLVLTQAQRSVAYERARISPALFGELVAGESESVRVLIQTDSHDYAAVVQAIEQAGGSVDRQFKYATGLAAELPRGALLDISRLPGVAQVSLDAIRELDTGASETQAFGGVMPLGSDHEAIDAGMRAGAAVTLDGIDYQVTSIDPLSANQYPATYANPATMEAGPVWDSGNFGQDSLVVVIDTGIYDQHFMLAGSVAGGVDMSPDVGTPFEGFNLASNHWHGTHVSGIVGGHGAILLPNAALLTQSIELYTGAPLPPFDASNKILPLFGMAPAAQLYGIKVFPHTGAGVSESLIIAAIEHAIDLKATGAMDVDVINMSLGGPNLFDGRDLEDQVVDVATSLGITVVSAASNDGPSSITVASPGSANSSVTVGAVAHPINSRVFWDQNFGSLGIGNFLFVGEDPQMIYFSSRGPTSDGRAKPTVSAVGVFVLSSFNTAAAPQSLAWASGTSMATPAAAGVAALLNTAGEPAGASPFDYKEALVASATPLPGYDSFDQGAGFISAAAAMGALQADASLGTPHPDLRNGYSRQAVQPKGKLIEGVNGRRGVTIEVEALAPGLAQHYYLRLQPNAERITIDVSNVDLGALDLGLNSFELYVQSASRTFENYYINSTNVYGDASFVIEDLSTTASGDIFGVVLSDLPLMPGYVKVVIENDWTSADYLSGTFNINVHSGNNSARADEVHSGTVNTGDSVGFFPVGFGPAGAAMNLAWDNDYLRYPAADLDLIVAWFDTDGNLSFNFAGASLNAPESIRLEAGNIAEIFVLIDGFQTYGVDEDWTLKVDYLD